MPVQQQPDAAGHTHQTRFRLPLVWWEAYGRVCERLGTNRTARLLHFIREDIRAHGDRRDLAALETGEQELAERRSRKGGRPPKA